MNANMISPFLLEFVKIREIRVNRSAISAFSFQLSVLTFVMSDLRWFVAHTRPRREKKLAQYAEREGLSFTLPCFKAAHKYRGKTVVFQKLVFPGYVFFRLLESQRQLVYQSDYVANLLKVPDEPLFEKQLGAVLQALETDLEVFLAPEIGPGKRVRITSGPLRGVEGWVEQRSGITTVFLKVDFISKAAAIRMPAHQLELT